MDSSLQRIGIAISKARKEKNYTTGELARVLKISTGKLNNIENGKNDCFQLELVKQLVDILEINVYEICGSAFYSSNIKDYQEYDSVINELIIFLKNNSNDINTLFIEKLKDEMNFIKNIKKTISND